MKYDIAYTSCSVNPGYGTAHLGANSLICFANCNCIHIYDPHYGNGGKIVYSLNGHLQEIIYTRWLSGALYEKELISVSIDGVVMLWSRVDRDYVNKEICQLKSRITVADGCYKYAKSNDCIIAIATLDRNFRIYHRKAIGDPITLNQEMPFGKSVIVSIRFSCLPVLNAMLIGLGMLGGNFLLLAEDKDFKFVKHVAVAVGSGSIYGLDFHRFEDELLIAAGCENGEIKMWVIEEYTDASEFPQHIRQTAKQFKIDSTKFVIYLHSELLGHNSLITSVYFDKHSLQLVSSSLNNKLIIWHNPEGTDDWIEKASFEGSRTGSYYGAMISVYHALAHDSFGVLYHWKYNPEEKKWNLIMTMGGHSDVVTDIAWEPSSQFIFSTSLDKTTRIHAPLAVSSCSAPWLEIIRPQTDIYINECLSLLSRYEYAVKVASGGIRIFKAPQDVIQILNNTFNIDNTGIKVLKQGDPNTSEETAALSLRLSTLTTGNAEDASQNTASVDLDSNMDKQIIPPILRVPPTEDELKITQWLESHNLHISETSSLSTIASTCDGTILAVATKSAFIFLWNTATWERTQLFDSQNSTITQLQFSEDSKFLLSVSTDHHWTLFQLDNIDGMYTLYANTQKDVNKCLLKNITCCAWLPNSQYFATACEEGKVVVWYKNPIEEEHQLGKRFRRLGNRLNLNAASITAMAVTLNNDKNCYLFAFGLKSGMIQIMHWDAGGTQNNWNLGFIINQGDAHFGRVNQLAFRKHTGRAGGISQIKKFVQLASCGADCVVRVINIEL